MKPNRVRLFVKSWCPWCSKAEAWLDARGVDYEVINVSDDDKAYDEMERLSGQTCAPTIVSPASGCPVLMDCTRLIARSMNLS